MPYKDKADDIAYQEARRKTPEWKAWRVGHIKTPRFRFNLHRGSAKQRGIQFLMTFEQWWALWAPHWDKRGYTTGGNLVMARTGDKGPYAVGNVRITTQGDNAREYFNNVSSNRL